MTNLQACLSYLSGAGFDRETLKTAREELAYLTQRSNSALPVTPADVERAATLAWNEALEAAARKAEDEARDLRADLPDFSSSVGVMTEAEAAVLESFSNTCRSLKRP